MDEWILQSIREYERHKAGSLFGYSEWIRGRLEIEMTAEEKSYGSLLHIAGMVDDQDGPHPVLYFVRNIVDIDSETGEYLGMGNHFLISEDFWSRDCASPEDRRDFRSGRFYMLYINGYPSGRIAYLKLSNYLRQYFSDVWRDPQSGFRPPITLAEVGMLVEQHLAMICAMFRISGISDPAIGGPVQTLLVPNPKSK